MVARPAAARRVLHAVITAWRDVAWGVAVLLVVGSCVGLVPLIASGRISAGVHVVWAGIACVAAAWVWSWIAMPVGVVLRLSLPSLSPGSRVSARDDASTVAAIAVLVALEVAFEAAAVFFARDHDASQAVGIIAVGVVVATVAWVMVSRAAADRVGRSLRVVAWLPLLVPAASWWCLPEHVRAHDVVGWSLSTAAVLPYAALVPRPRRFASRAALHAAAIASLVAIALAFGRHPGVAAALVDRHAPVRWVIAAGARATDFDGDGASSLFGGRDCVPFDARQRSGGDEIAGNGIDDNCLRGDLVDDGEPVLPNDADGPQTSATNILVISVDALRPDRMSIYGYDRPTTPQIEDAFADAIRFEHAYAEAASTRDTLPSVLTGRRLFELVWHRNKAVVLDPRTRTIAHSLTSRGWHTFGVLPFVALNMIGATDLGFAVTEIYDEKPDVTAPSVTRSTLAALDRGAEPFFGFVHYYEPHEPYRPHLRQRKVSDQPYDQEIATVDDAIGDLIDGLRERGLLERTVVVLTSDHGEAFGEHGHRFHNEGVNEEDLRVPWLMRVPGVAATVVVPRVSTTALVATLCDVLGVPLPEAAPPTVLSVWPLVTGDAEVGEPVVASARVGLDRERFAAIAGDVKILFDRELSSFELFDLGNDPAEQGSVDDLPSTTIDAGVALAQDVLERVIGGAASRRRTASSVNEKPSSALTPPTSHPAIVGAWAEVSRGLDGSGLPPRVLVHTVMRSELAEPYDVVLLDGETVTQRVTGVPASAAHDEPLVIDVRTFKVYVEDAHHVVELRAGAWRWSLGAVAGLSTSD